MDYTQFEEVLAQAAPQMPGVEEIRRLGDAGWAVLFEDGVQITVERNGLAGGIGLTGTLGHPAVDRRFVVYEAMLAFNALARENAGARVALHGEGGQSGELVLEMDLPSQRFTGAQVEDLLKTFSEAARRWREYVELEPENLELPPLSFMNLRA